MSAVPGSLPKADHPSTRKPPRWPWIIAGVIAAIASGPWVFHHFRLWFSDEYRQQARIEKEEKYDVTERLNEDRELQARVAQWRVANRDKAPDWPYHRTFIAYMPQGIADLDTVVHGVLSTTGRRLTDHDLVRMRLHPENFQISQSSEPRLLANAGGTILLWSNGVVTALRGNLPFLQLDLRTNQFVYSEQFRDRPSSDPIAPPILIRDAMAVSSTVSSDFGLILRRDGTVWGLGGNEYGQLGTNARSFSGITLPVQGLNNVVAIAAGLRHAIALTADGRVWQWGQDDLPYGFWSYEFHGHYKEDPAQRAPEGFNPTARPVERLSDVVKIAAAGTTSYALDKNGFVWVWGGGSRCRLVPAEPGGVTLKRPINSDLRVDSMVVARPFRIPELSEVVDIKVADTHAVVLRRDGTVWAWGCNAAGQIGQAEFLKDQIRSGGNYQGKDRPRPMFDVNHVKRIFTSASFSAVLKDNDTLWFTGEGCRLCTGGIAQAYSYGLKVKDSLTGMRQLEFEAFAPSTSYPRNSEWGIYWVDDSFGRIDGIDPWQSGYAELALSPERAVTVFDRVVPMGTKKYLEAPSGRMFGMYIVSGGNRSQWRAALSNARLMERPAAYFSFPFPNQGLIDAVEVKFYPDGTQKQISVGWLGPQPDSEKYYGRSSIGQTVLIRGVRQLRYEELPNHEMSAPTWHAPR